MALSVLAACGGGGSATVVVVSDPIDMYVGRWGSACMLLVGGYSTHYVYSIDKWNATTAIGAFQGVEYSNPTCSGSGYVVDTSYNHSFTAQIAGEKVVQGRLTNKMIYQFSGGTVFDVWFTDGVNFMNGSTFRGYDGYPDSFASMTFVRR
jgi:hypothetical protein